MKDFMQETWENVRHALTCVIAAPVALIAVIAAAVLHGAVFALDEIDPLDAEFEELENE